MPCSILFSLLLWLVSILFYATHTLLSAPNVLVMPNLLLSPSLLWALPGASGCFFFFSLIHNKNLPLTVERPFWWLSYCVLAHSTHLRWVYWRTRFIFGKYQQMPRGQSQADFSPPVPVSKHHLRPPAGR